MILWILVGVIVVLLAAMVLMVRGAGIWIRKIQAQIDLNNERMFRLQEQNNSLAQVCVNTYDGMKEIRRMLHRKTGGHK